MKKNKDREVHIDETTYLPETIESQGFVYEDRFKKIEKITAKFDGFTKEYFVSDFGEKAAVLVVRNNRVLLARQYRLLINCLSYEVPGGKVEETERPEEAAMRECLEETGVRCKNLKSLIDYELDLEYTKNRTHVFYAHETENDQAQSSSRHEWLPLDDCLKMIEQGIIRDSLSIISILLFCVKINR
jgi:ADP-ribose pyrophosphatase|tara:strand:- start:2667 stop:3227 length:561 start_codon:yes stop_codon:yes gene_type:complete